MSDKAFNLLYEPWILVMRTDGDTEEVSLFTLFERAHEFKCLAGELPTQDVAILRLLLAILHAFYERYDCEGNSAPLHTAPFTDALDRWEGLWTKGRFNFELVHAYLRNYEERFYLFHPEYPFYQVPFMGKGTEYFAGKLNGEVSESSNKIRLFAQRTGEAKNALLFPEAVRWLIYLNAFDDTSGKPTRAEKASKDPTPPTGAGDDSDIAMSATISQKESKMPSPGAGWLGKLGLIYATGNNLFETLLLNLVFLKNGDREPWGAESPLWEKKVVKTKERTEIPMPNNQSELLTLQSRRLLLKREGEYVTGVLLLGGDFFPKENAFNEQMTVWRNAATKDTATPEYTPKRHDPSRQFWRDFPVFAVRSETTRRPGVIDWLAMLKSEKLLSRTHFSFETPSVKYGDKDFFADDVFTSSISFSGDLLTELGDVWIPRIIESIDTADRLADQLGQLSQSLAKAAGDSDGLNQRGAAKEQAYYQLDMPFREWLASIDINGDKQDACDKWWTEAQGIIRKLGEQLIAQAGIPAFVGRTIMENKKEQTYNAPMAYNRFKSKTFSLEALKSNKTKTPKGGK